MSKPQLPQRMVDAAVAVKTGAAAPGEAYAAAIKQPVVMPSLQFTVAHFTRRELETLRKVLRDSDYEHLWRDVMGPALKRGDGR